MNKSRVSGKLNKQITGKPGSRGAVNMKKLPFTTLFFSILALIWALPVFAQSNTDQVDADEQESGDIEEVIVTGSQIRGAAINDALSISVISAEDIEAFGLESGDELLEAMPEQGQNFFNEAENISGGVNSARGDIGAFNLRNIGTGNTLVLLNGRRVVNSATFQTEEVGGSFVPVNSANATTIPVFGVNRVEILRDGASAIYGADAVAGVVNTVMKDNYDGFAIRGRWTEFDNIPRDDQSVTIEWGTLFNDDRSAVGIFANYYHRDRVNSQDDPKWADSDFRRFIPDDSPWSGDTRFRNNSANSNWGQYDIRTGGRNPYGLQDLGVTDRNGRLETYPVGDSRCDYFIAENVCGAPNGAGTFRYNLNENRDISSELDRYNVYAYFNHEWDNGIQFYSELSYYKSKTNLFRHPSAPFSTVDLQIARENYYNPFGPCSSPNRLPESVIGTEVPCEGVPLIIDNYRFAEVPRVVDNDGKDYRILAGLRGSFGQEWDWDSAILYSKSRKDEVTHNRVSNTLIEEALADPNSSAYNPWGGGVNTNIERALVDVYRNSEADLTLIDFKLTNIGLFDIWGGPVGFLAGAEYRDESFKDDRDPRLDGTIVFTDRDGDTYPFVSDVVNSSPTPDNSGSRDVFSLFTEFIMPLHSTLDLQLALRYENFSDVGSTMVPKVAFGWRPTNWLMFRGSWSEAFRAPNLVTVNETIIVRNNTRTDWACTYAADFGGDPDQDTLDCINSTQRRASGSDDLQPEKSDNYSLGIVLTPLETLTLTLDFWKIEKKDTIGLFGEENHTMLDLAARLEAGLGNCASFEGNPAVARDTPAEDEAEIYLHAGICPGGDIEYIDDQYANLDTRVVEGYDFGVYYDLPTDIGDWAFSWRGSIYTRYDQEPGVLAGILEAAKCTGADQSGCIPINYPIAGLGDLLRINGNQEEKMNASLRWNKSGWGAAVSWFYLGDFIQDSLDIDNGDGTLTRWVVPSYSTWNLSADYAFDLWSSRTRVRLGVNNVGNERAPLADRYFGYFSDAHRDTGRSYFIDLRMAW
jgi:outer membrane receptor protein involved in Fe transport